MISVQVIKYIGAFLATVGLVGAVIGIGIIFAAFLKALKAYFFK